MQRLTKKSVMSRLLTRLSKFLGWISGVAATILILTVVPDVTGRYLFNKPIQGSYEIAQMLMVVIIWFSLASVEEQKGHLRVEVIGSRLSEHTRTALDLLASVLGILMFSAITWLAIVSAIGSVQLGEVHPGVAAIPIYPFRWILAIGILFLALQFLRNTLRAAQQLAKGKV